METFPPLVSADRALVLAAPSAVKGERSTTQDDPSLVDVPIGGVSYDDLLPQTCEDETMKEVSIDDGRVTTKQQIT